MAETNVAEVNLENEIIPDAPVMGKVVSKGKPIAKEGSKENKAADVTQEEINIEGKEKNGKKETGSQPDMEISDEKLAAYFKKNGIEYEGIEKLKERFQPAKAEPTDEEKIKIQEKKDKRLLDKFLKEGGKVEGFVAAKSLANADLTELSLTILKNELKTEGFSDEKIDQIIKQKYFQYSDEEIESLDDEDEKKEALKLKEYGAKKLANRSSYTKTKAQEVIDGLKKAIEAEDLQEQEEITTASKVDAYLKNLPRKQTLKIGEVDGKTIEPIEYDVSEPEIVKALAVLKDPVKRNQFLYTEDGNLNLTNLSDLFVQNALLKSQLQRAYQTGGSRQVEIFEKTFGAGKATDIGIGGAPSKRSNTQGQPVKKGKISVASFTNN